MVKDILLLGSTGSIGETTLKILKKNKNKFRVTLLTTNKNVNKIYKQALFFGVKNIVITDKKKYFKFKDKFKKKKINIHLSVEHAVKRINKKAFLTINAISGIEGLEPTLTIIKHTKYLAIANKESIICGWRFIKNELKKNKTIFVPLDSEHFSIWKLIKNDNYKNIKKIYLTASGGPFLNKKKNYIKNINPKEALKHPNWKMGKKISIDSSTMMNKIFEVIEAIKIFNLKKEEFEILIHPKSFIHAIVHYKNGLTKLLAHETTMEIPILNSLFTNNEQVIFNQNDFNYSKLNGTNFSKPNLSQFPLLKILNYDFNNTFFEIILVTINDELVKKYLEKRISYISIQFIMLKLLKKPYFKKNYNKKPKNINDIKIMVKKVKIKTNEYLESNVNFS